MGKPLFKQLLSLLFSLFPLIASAAYKDPTYKTNINQRTDLFERSIDDLKGLERQIESGKAAAIGDLGGDNGTLKGLEFIAGKSKSEIEAEAGNLKAIGANDLNAKGREE